MHGGHFREHHELRDLRELQVVEQEAHIRHFGHHEIEVPIAIDAEGPAVVVLGPDFNPGAVAQNLYTPVPEISGRFFLAGPFQGDNRFYGHLVLIPGVEFNVGIARVEGHLHIGAYLKGFLVGPGLLGQPRGRAEQGRHTKRTRRYYC